MKTSIVYIVAAFVATAQVHRSVEERVIFTEKVEPASEVVPVVASTVAYPVTTNYAIVDRVKGHREKVDHGCSAKKPCKGKKCVVASVGTGSETWLPRDQLIGQPIYTCPKRGYKLNKHVCQRETTFARTPLCPASYQHVNGVCVTAFEPISVCPEGITKNGLCIKTEYTPVEHACPDSYEKFGVGYCRYYETVKLMKSCPKNSFIRPDGSCATVKYEDPEYVCPPSYRLIHDRCEREAAVEVHAFGERKLAETEGDHTAVDYYDFVGERQEEGSHQLMCSKKHGCHSYFLEAPLPVNLDLIQPVVPELGAPAYYPQQEYAEPVWNKSYIMLDSRGEPSVDESAASFHDQSMAHSVGAMTYGDMSSFAHAKMLVDTPADYSIEASADSHTRKHVHSESKRVVKVISQAAERICRRGVLSGDRCVVYEPVEHISRCPIKTGNKGCQINRTVPAMPVCPPGFNVICPKKYLSSVACTCERITTVQSKLICPFDTTLEGRKCVKTIPAIRSCPPGSELDPRDSDMCVRVITEPAFATYHTYQGIAGPSTSGLTIGKIL